MYVFSTFFRLRNFSFPRTRVRFTTCFRCSKSHLNTGSTQLKSGVFIFPKSKVLYLTNSNFNAIIMLIFEFHIIRGNIYNMKWCELFEKRLS